MVRFAVVAALFLGAPVAALAQQDLLHGEWRGSYNCGPEVVGVTIDIGPRRPDASHDGIFTFYPVDGGAHVKTGAYSIRINTPVESRTLVAKPVEWIIPAPGYSHYGFTASIDAGGRIIEGKMDRVRCQGVRVAKDGKFPGGVTAPASNASQEARRRKAATDKEEQERLERVAGSDRRAAERRAAMPRPVSEEDRMNGERRALISRLVGRWDGAVYSRSVDTVRMSLEFSERQTVTDGVFLDVKLASTYMGGKYGLVLDRSGEARIERIDVPADERGRHFMATVTRNSSLKDGFGRDVLQLSTFSRSTAYLFREATTATPFLELCETHRNWITRRYEAWGKARALKTRYFTGLGGYNAQDASLSEAFADDTFKKYFGLTVGEMTDARFNELLRNARDCAVTRSSVYRPELIEGIVNVRVSEADVNGFRSGFWVHRPGSLPTSRAQALAIIEAAKESGQVLKALSRELDGLDDARSIEQKISAAIAGGAAVARPDALEAALAAAGRKLAALREAGARKLTDEREARHLRRMQGVRIPQEAIPAGRRELVAALVAGKLTRLNGDAQSFFGGVVDQAIGGCGLPSSTAERLALLRPMVTATDRAVFGTAYGDADLLKMLGSMAGGQATHVEGQETVKAITCADPFLGVLLAAIADVSANAGQATDGRESLFVRTCSNDRPREQCECVAREARSVIPDIDGRSYSRDIFPMIINANPGVSLRVGLVCRVGNY